MPQLLEHPQSDLSTETVFRFINHHLPELAKIKRFVERWQGDKKFRQKFDRAPDATLTEYNLELTYGDLAYLLNTTKVPLTPLGQTIQSLSQTLQDTETITETHEDSINHAFHDERFRQWRSRQVYRLQSQQVQTGYSDIGHFPMSFELSKGCSVGCWFCSLAPEKLDQVIDYTPESAKLWQDLLTMAQKKIGPAVQESFCYWATDPLDNPDYEKFVTDFYHVLGRFPMTTTAQASRYPDRARALLTLSEKCGAKMRFSVLSVGMLNKIHRLFSPEELSSTRLLLQMDGAIGVMKSNAGRARSNQSQRREDSIFTEDFAPSSVSGFLVNMVSRQVQLITPCPPSDRWPSGHRIHAKGSFETVADLETLMEQMIQTHMPTEIRADDIVKLRSDLSYTTLKDGFQLSTRCKHFKFQGLPLFKDLGGRLHQGTYQLTELVQDLEALGTPADKTNRIIQQLFQRGFLHDGFDF